MIEASPDFSDGCMIALHPNPQLAQFMAVDGGLPASELHVTVAYIGDAADVDADTVLAAAAAVTGRPQVEARMSGHARFTGGDSDVIVALVDSADLEDLRRDLLDALAEQGIAVPRDHGFCPHQTLLYLGAEEASPVERLTAIDTTFAALSVVHGTTRTDLPFTGAHPIAGVAREAYAHGVAASGGPITDRVRAGCAAAVALAVEHADDPAILEVTLKLGQLEGTWATLFHRREQLTAAHVQQVADVWRAIVGGLDVHRFIRRYRADTYMPAEAAKDPLHPTRREEARRAALGFLAGVHNADGYDRLRDAVADALRSAAAEGHTAGAAIHAEHTETVAETVAEDTGDLDVAFQGYYDQLGSGDWPGMADGWVTRIVDGSAGDVATKLAAMNRDGASYEDMVAAVSDLLDSADGVTALLDYAMAGAINQASVDLYASEGVLGYDVLTAGDTRVCGRCLEAEGGNPHRITEPAPVPAHPSCRCAVSVAL